MKLLDVVTSNLFCNISHENLPLVNENYYLPSLSETVPELCVKRQKFETNTNHKQYNFTNADFLVLYNVFLQTNWTYLNDIETKWINFMREFMNYWITILSGS